jgi:hypothetical protein
MTRRSGGALLITLLLAAGCSESKRPPGKGTAGAGEVGPGDAGAPGAPAEHVIAVAIAAAERPGAPAMERDVAIPVEERR